MIFSFTKNAILKSYENFVSTFLLALPASPEATCISLAFTAFHQLAVELKLTEFFGSRADQDFVQKCGYVAKKRNALQSLVEFLNKPVVKNDPVNFELKLKLF